MSKSEPAKLEKVPVTALTFTWLLAELMICCAALFTIFEPVLVAALPTSTVLENDPVTDVIYTLLLAASVILAAVTTEKLSPDKLDRVPVTAVILTLLLAAERISTPAFVTTSPPTSVAAFPIRTVLENEPATFFKKVLLLAAKLKSAPVRTV